MQALESRMDAERLQKQLTQFAQHSVSANGECRSSSPLSALRVHRSGGLPADLPSASRASTPVARRQAQQILPRCQAYAKRVGVGRELRETAEGSDNAGSLSGLGLASDCIGTMFVFVLPCLCVIRTLNMCPRLCPASIPLPSNPTW